MKRTVSWLTKLFVSSVVAMALVIALGVQQAQAADLGFCCNEVDKVYLKNYDDYCNIKPEAGYSSVSLGNYSTNAEAKVIASVDGPGGYSKDIYIPPQQSQAENLPPGNTERFILRSTGDVGFQCYR